LVADDPRLGVVLGGRYRVDELIGRGGMSIVYRGFDTQLHRPVAVKIFQHGDDEDQLRWESEVRLLSQLSHPHLVTLHDAHLERTNSVAASYLVMEYVPGVNLQQHLALQGASSQLAALVVAQIGEALASVHSRGIVHRDLKPGNILIEPSEMPPLFVRTKLADFGIAHLLGSDRVTRTGTMIGTAAYTSPEQVNGDVATPISDVYSLGLVAIECLSGEPAFPGTPSESLIARLTRDPVLPPNLPPEWAMLLMSMTARDPAFRPTALDAALRSRDLVRLVAEGSPVGNAPPTVPLNQTERMLPPTRLLPAAGAVAASAGQVATKVVEYASDSPPRGDRARSRRPLLVGLISVAAAALIAGAAALSQLTPGSAAPNGSTSTTPHITPKPVSTSATPLVASPSPATKVPGSGSGNGHGRGNGKKNG
jgi:serine/threonine protein kinase